MDDLRIKLFWYIDFCNCDTVEEILKVKKVHISRLSLQEMDNFSEGIEKILKKLLPLIEQYTDFEGVPSYNDEGIMALTKIVNALTITEG